MAKDIMHAMAKRSWWDGSVIALCGQKYRPGYYKEPLVSWGEPVTCPGCKAAMKTRKR